MKIEIYSIGKHNVTVNGLDENYNKLINQSDRLINDLCSIKNFAFSMNGGIGMLQNAVSFVEYRIICEQRKKDKLIDIKSKTNDFIEIAHTKDRNVAEVVSNNKDEFYHLNEWAKPSFNKDSLMDWYSNAKRWLKSAGNTIKNELSHTIEVAFETDFKSLSDEQLKEYIKHLKEKLEMNQLDNDDRIRLNTLFMYLSKGSFEHKAFLLEVLGLINPDELSRIENEIKDRGYDAEKALWIKYFMSKGTSVTSAEKLYDKWTNKRNVIADISLLEESPKDGSFKQGNFHIGELNVSRNIDGSCDISLSAKQTSAAKSYGAVIVYDSEGHVKEIKVLDRYQNPTNPYEACKTIWSSWHGKDYTETKVKVTVPKGGYIQITDDPDEIAIVQTGMASQEIVDDKIKDIIKDAVVNTIKEKTGIGKVGKHAADSVVSRAEIIAEVKEAYEITTKTAEVVDKIEEVYWSAQQKGSGSTIIYND